MVLRWLSAPFSIPAKGEKLYSQWRCSWWLFVVLYFWFFVLVPSAYWDLKSSVCESVYGNQKPFSDSIHNDPYLNEFPCGDEPFEPKSGIPFMVLNGMRTLSNEPLPAIEWYLVNQWWVVPYQNALNPAIHGSGILLFLPFIATFHLLFPNWMVDGGYTLILMSFRVYKQLVDIWYEVMDGYDRAHALKSKLAIHWEFQQMIMKIVLGSVPFRLQVPLTLFSIASTIVMHVLVQHFHDLGEDPWFRVQLFLAALGGAVCGVLITHTEEFALRWLSPSWDAANDTAPIGPVLAIKNAWSATTHLVRNLLNSPQGVEYLVTAVLLAACVVVLTIRDDIVLLL